MVQEDLTGKTFNNWTIIKELGRGKVLCQCNCKGKTVRELYKKAVKSGQSKSCGCLRVEHCRNTKESRGKPETKYKGMQIKGWTVVDKIPKTQKVICEDKDGNQRTFYISHFLRGYIASPDYSKLNDLTGKTFNNWTVIEELRGGKVKCLCNCDNKTEKVIYKSSLLNGKSKSCGCMAHKHCKNTMLDRYGDICTLKINSPRESWQIEVLNNKDKFIEYLKSFKDKIYIDDLSEILKVNKTTIIRTIHKYKAEQLVQFMYSESYVEKEITKLINEHCKVVNRHLRDIISPYELDIYIPENRLAIEFNGNYWHSNKFKDKYYHQLKTLMCLKSGIRLLHIFEYEWINNKEIVTKIILDALGHNTKDITESKNDLKVLNIDSCIAESFSNKTSTEEYRQSSINLGLYYKNELVAISLVDIIANNNYQMRYIKSFEYKIDNAIEKFIAYLIENFNTVSITSYCDISKIDIKEYIDTGFVIVDILEPDYIICDNHNNIIKNIENIKSTEFAIYDSGKAKLVWNNTERTCNNE